MNRNSAHFETQPYSVDIQRSRFENSSTHKTTFNAGELIPIFVKEILPGDTMSLDLSYLTRMSTPVFPVMDSAFMDTFFFFVPNRLVWDHWRELNGENRQGYWTQPVEYEVPQISLTSAYKKGSIADYMGVPTEVADGELTINALPFRDYALIWNEFFRDENSMNPVFCPTDDVMRANASSDPLHKAILGLDPLPVCKPFDYFTSCLPEPQKGAPVTFNAAGYAPVVVTPEDHAPFDREASVHMSVDGLSDNTIAYDHITSLGLLNNTPGDPAHSSLEFTTLTPGNLPGGGESSPYLLNNVIPSNLWADMFNITIGTINDLREAFQLQHLLEVDALSGTRYTEILYSHFHVTSPDSRLQRPEYLGGNRTYINVDQVLQTSSTTDTSPQGNTAAYSMTTSTGCGFTKSFVEHGFVIGLACVRTEHTYQQGLEKFWTRKRRFDYYWPEFANIGNQPVTWGEIRYTNGFHTNPDDPQGVRLPDNDNVFGYNEAWADYRVTPNRVSGAFRSNYGQSLDVWHYADYFKENQQLSESFLKETKDNIDRTLAVSSSVEDQFISDFYFNVTMVRPMPMYSIPGLIGHY